MKPFLKVLLVFLFLGCEKKLIDYRNKYTGTWEFNYAITDCSIVGVPCDTIRGSSTGQIFYNKDNSKGLLYIQFTPGRDTQYGIDKNGHFTDCNIEGEFSDKKHVAFKQVSRAGCTLNGHSGSSYTVTGVRKNNQ